MVYHIEKILFLFSGPLGVIEFTVNFIKDDRRLDVKIHNAKVNAGFLQHLNGMLLHKQRSNFTIFEEDISHIH